MPEESKTLAWQQYERGVDYKTRIGLYKTVDLNERFFIGNHWEGIPHEGLPTPVLNFCKRSTTWKIAAVTDRRTKMQFTAEGQSQDILVKQISDYCDILWERLKMDYLTKEGLKDACISGDYIQYFFWDSSIHTGQYSKIEKPEQVQTVDENGMPVIENRVTMVNGTEYMGDINTKIIDNVNYYPGDPNEANVQNQPYIILSFREHIDHIRAEAKKYKVKFDETGDDDTDYTSGDMGKVELDDSSKLNVLLKLYKKDGQVYAEKSTRNTVIRPEWPTGLTRYPIAMMNWELRKNCCHGVAEITGLIPNQVFINKLLAMAHLNQMKQGFPKVIYDKTRIKQWTDRVGAAVPVNGSTHDAVFVANSATNNVDNIRLIDTTLKTTMEMMGANDVTLGNISNPDNTSAFIATRDAAMVPLQSTQERFYSMIEDIGLIWFDFIRAFYTDRQIPIEDNGEITYVPLPDIKDVAMRVKIDVGPSTMWSEIQTIQTLDGLYKAGKITTSEYLDRMVKGLIPKSDELKQAYAEVDDLQKQAMIAQYNTQIMQAQMMEMQIQNPQPAA